MDTLLVGRQYGDGFGDVERTPASDPDDEVAPFRFELRHTSVTHPIGGSAHLVEKGIGNPCSLQRFSDGLRRLA